MGIGSHFNCCGKSDLKKTVLIIDENNTDNQEVANKENEDKKIIEKKNIIQSNTNFNRDYTFQAKSSQCTNSVLVLPNNESDVNKDIEVLLVFLSLTSSFSFLHGLLSLIYFTEDGILQYSMSSLFAKATAPIATTESGRVILWRFLP